MVDPEVELGRAESWVLLPELLPLEEVERLGLLLLPEERLGLLLLPEERLGLLLPDERLGVEREGLLKEPPRLEPPLLLLAEATDESVVSHSLKFPLWGRMLTSLINKKAKKVARMRLNLRMVNSSKPKRALSMIQV